MYAFLDENSICFACTEQPVKGHPVIYCQPENLGQRYVITQVESEFGETYDVGTWEAVEAPQEPQEAHPHEPTNAELAQQISDLKVDLIIAGVIE